MPPGEQCKITTFDLAFNYTVENEGGYSYHKDDRGGATRYGITRKNASLWRGRDVTAEEMRNFPIEEAKEIYRKLYWQELNCDLYNYPGVSVAIFDIGVVCGPPTSARLAQRVCASRGAPLRIDGIIGRSTIQEINSLSDSDFIRDFSALSIARFKGIIERNPSQGAFQRGWIARGERLLSLIGLERY